MTYAYDVIDLRRWLEPVAGSLCWVSIGHLAAKPRRLLREKAPPEFTNGGYAYLYGEYPKGRAKRGLAANEFWFRGQVLDGERVIQLLEMLS